MSRSFILTKDTTAVVIGAKPFSSSLNFPILLICSIITIAITGCVAGRGSLRTNNEITRNTAPSPAGTVYTGVASYYGEEFAGRKTYNGEVYDPMGLTAAHQFLPMGTMLRITNLKNNRIVQVRINDRMPYHADRIIDLSKGAAQELGMIKDGLIKVKIEVIEPD